MLDLIKRNLLKYTLLVDGVVSVAAGIAFLTFSTLVAELIGPAFTTEILIGLGAFLLLWGLFHLAVSFQEVVHSEQIEETGVTTQQFSRITPNEHP